MPLLTFLQITPQIYLCKPVTSAKSFLHPATSIADDLKYLLSMMPYFRTKKIVNTKNVGNHTIFVQEGILLNQDKDYISMNNSIAMNIAFFQ